MLVYQRVYIFFKPMNFFPGTLWPVFGRVTHIYISIYRYICFFLNVCESSASSTSTLHIGWWMSWMSVSLIHPESWSKGPRGEVKHIHHSLRYGRTFEGEAAGLNSTALRKLPANHQARTVVCHEVLLRNLGQPWRMIPFPIPWVVATQRFF